MSWLFPYMVYMVDMTKWFSNTWFGNTWFTILFNIQFIGYSFIWYLELEYWYYLYLYILTEVTMFSQESRVDGVSSMVKYLC